MALRQYATDLNEYELAFGFSVEPAKTGVRVVLRHLSRGLRAVKVYCDDGTIEYVICDEHLQPLYGAAKSLDELRVRFGV